MNLRAATPEIDRGPRLVAALLPLVAAVGLGACVLGGSSSGATGSLEGTAATLSGAPSAVAETPAGPMTTSAAAGWGPIWDALPASFPTYPGAEPVPDPAGASTAALTVPASTADAAAWWQRALGGGGYGGIAVSKPLEDGSVVIDGAGPAGCRVRVRVAPTSATTTATIFYGAACPSK